MGVSAGGYLLFYGADDLSRDVQEEDGANEGQCQDEDNEGVAVGHRNSVTGSMAGITRIVGSRARQNGPDIQGMTKGLTLATQESHLCTA